MSGRCTLAVLVLVCGCAQRAQLPAADAPQRPFPDMSGQAVMVLPVQPATPPIAAARTAPAPGVPVALSTDARITLETELAYWLPETAPRVRWTLSAAVEQAVQRAPTLNVHVRALPVQDFLRARLTSIGDPLYTELRQVALLTNVRPALLPIGAVWVPEGNGTGRVHISLALIDTTGGAVLWSGIVAGSPGPAVNATTIASAAQALGRLAAR